LFIFKSLYQNRGKQRFYQVRVSL